MKHFNFRTTGLTVFVLLILGLAACTSEPAGPQPPAPVPGKLPKEDRVDLAIQMEFELTKDPATNTVPRERLYGAWAEAQRRMGSMPTRNGIHAIQWEERGPNNVGGRTRAILIDKNDPSGNTIWAGSVSGGLYKTTNITASDPQWQPVNDLFDNLAVTCIAQDPTNPDLIYFGTGEGWFNADALRGLGIWKSSDGGTTWNRLPSTDNSSFYYTQRLKIDETGAVFAGTRSGGLQKSTDGGNTWTTVLGLGNFSNRSDVADIEIASDGDMYVSMGVFNAGSIFKSTNRGTSWTELAGGLPSVGYERAELASAPSNPDRLYVLLQDGSNNQCLGIYRSNNGGITWTEVDNPGAIGMSSFTRNQAWYDLIVGVDPNNPDVVIIGGVDLLRSTNGGNSWTQITQWFGGGGLQYVHADQHEILYAEGSSNVVYFGNDGGIWRSSNGGLTIEDKSLGYVSTQFYACAIHPETDVDYYIGGTQDNGTHSVRNPGVGPTVKLSGGDGSFTHIDEDEPNIQMSGYTYQNYVFTVNNWNSSQGMGDGSDSGQFINPTDYDSESNILYCAHDPGGFYRISGIGGSRSETYVSVPGFGGASVRHVMVSPNVSNRVYFGMSNGRVYRVDNANSTPVATHINPSGGPRGSISCVAIEEGNDFHLLVTASNYGIPSVWESYDGGGTWYDREGDLPDMPVRWAMFNPNDNNSALIATELGIWATDNLNNTVTSWLPNASIPNTRVSMLQKRSSNTVLAGTYGRGLFTTSAFELPQVNLVITPGLIQEGSDGGRLDDCNGFSEFEVKFTLSAPPNEAVPVYFGLGPNSNVEPEDYAFFPSQLVIVPPGATDTQSVTIRVVNDGLQESSEFIELMIDLPVPGRAIIGDDNSMFVVISDGLTEFNKVASELDLSDSHPVGPGRTVYFYTPDQKLLAKFQNLSQHDFGCVSVTIDRAGTGTADFLNPYKNLNDLAEKTLLVSAENPSDTASYSLTLYLSGAEIDGWENATGLTAESDIRIIRSSGAIRSITPDAPGEFVAVAPLTKGIGGTSLQLTGVFSGVGGFGFGAGNRNLQLAGNELVFDGEPLEERNRLFWELSGSYDWTFFDVLEVDDNGTETYLTTVNAVSGQNTYEAFDTEPVEGINRYRLYLQNAEGDFAFSDIVEIVWENVPKQIFPVAPNPFVDALSIFPGDENVAYSISLYNLSGQLVASDSFVSDGIFTWDLLPYSIAGGVYLLTLEAEGKERQVFKLMKR